MRGIEHIPCLYDAGMAVMETTGLRRWREWLVRGAEGRVLELGCGTGRNLPLYRTAPIASDPDLVLVLAARRRAPHARFFVGAAESIPLRDGSVDMVVTSFVMCSVDDPLLSLREIARVLRSDGSLRAIEHVRSTSAIAGRLQDAVQPVWTWFTGGCHPNRDTEAAVREAGFALEGRRARGTLRRFVGRPPPSL